MRVARIAAIVGLAAAIGVAIFAGMVWRATSTERAESSVAERRFAAQRAEIGPAEPLLKRDESGTLVRRQDAPTAGEIRPRHLRILAYWSRDSRLVQTEVPFWFFRLKGPALALALRRTGIDLEALGLTPADLARSGPGLVLDELRPGGDRLLVWLE